LQILENSGKYWATSVMRGRTVYRETGRKETRGERKEKRGRKERKGRHVKRGITILSKY
jgi:hypothetical protein